MSKISSLPGGAFTGDKKRNFKDLLSVLDHVNPIFVPREEFDNKNGEFLMENGKIDNLGIFYDLYLPQDLMKGEQLEMILFLTEKFGLAEYSRKNIEELLGKIKLLVAGVLKKEGGQEFINEAIEKYGISNTTIDQINKAPIKLGNRLKDSESRQLIKIVQSRLEENGGITPLERKTIAFEFGGAHVLENELEKVFFRKGLNMLRHGAMSMTDREVTTIRGKLKENGYKLDNSDEQRDYWKGVSSEEEDDYVWTVMRNDISYDSEEILLRRKMRVDEWKERINEAKKSGNQVLVKEVELEASRFVLKILQESYIYQTHSEVEGYNLVNIGSKKELQCFGFTILGHVFLSEIGIRHYVISGIPQHVTLAVSIDGDFYLFEGTSVKSLTPIKRNSTGGKSGYDVEIWEENYKVTFDDPEKAIFEGIKYHLTGMKDPYY